MSSNANDPAYPHHKEDSHGFPVMGLTKRELFAAMAMQGFLANPTTPDRVNDIKELARDAAFAADALLAELEARK